MPCALLHDKIEDISEWTDYVDTIIGSSVIESCVIYNMRGRVLAAGQSGEEEELVLHEGEAAHMVEALSSSLNPKYSSLEICGQHYRVIINDGRHGMLLKSGVRYATVCRTSKVLIVGLHKVNTKTDESSAAIMNLGDFLITKGM